MTEKAEAAPNRPSGGDSAGAAASAVPESRPKPRVAVFIATAGGLGYLPKAPGTWGSIAGAVIGIICVWATSRRVIAIANLERPFSFWSNGLVPGYTCLILALIMAFIGVWAAGQAARVSGSKDPQYVVIDEVSGQLLAYFLPFTVLNWKSWLLGFILFRVFDIWKPFPARQAESLPGGWGIMADDWIAGIYAAVVLWALRGFGL